MIKHWAQLTVSPSSDDDTIFSVSATTRLRARSDPHFVGRAVRRIAKKARRREQFRRFGERMPASGSPCLAPASSSPASCS
jgi:hypothetical protein